MELFARPVYFMYALPVIAGVIGVWWLGNVLKKRMIHTLFALPSYQQLTANLRPESRVRTALLLLSLLFLFAALAGPQWGTEIITAQGEFAQTVIAVDVSASMRAQDIKPDRLSSAKTMLQMLVRQLKDERIGLIAFTSQAFIQCPITTDEEALNYFIATLQPDMLPVPGTSLAAPVVLGARMLARYPGKKALILLTDGEDHAQSELETAQQAALKAGVRVIAIGIGTESGELIPDTLSANGQVLSYKKDKAGKTVVSKLDKKTLLSLAQATGGAYMDYTTPAQVAEKVEEDVRGLDRSTAQTAQHVLYKNRYAWPLTLALLCLAGFIAWPRGRKPVKKGTI